MKRIILTVASVAALAAVLAKWGPQEQPELPVSRKITVVAATKKMLEPAPASAPASGLMDFDPQRLLAEIATTHDAEALVLVDRIYNAPTTQEKGIVADALAARGGFESVANLLRVAGLHEETADRAAILDGLKNVQDVRGFETLASALAATRDPQFLDATVENLARCGLPSVLGTVVELYRERNDAPSQKSAALRAVAAMRSQELARALAKLSLQAPEPALAEAAATALAHIPR